MLNYTEFINESNNTNLTYSAITALAVFNPDFFNFINDIKNKYTFTDNSFWQSFLIELSKSRTILVDKEHLNDIKGISIEYDWQKLKKCVAAANIIKEKFPDIETIKIGNDNSLFINTIAGTSLLRTKKNEDKVSQSDIEYVLGINKELYNQDWDYLVSKWIETLSSNLNDVYKKYLDFFIDKFEYLKLPINWKNYKNFKVKGLGIKIDTLPKLYYNSLYDFSVDVSKCGECFLDYKKFLNEWNNVKNDILNKKILYPLLAKETNRTEKWKEIIAKINSLGTVPHFRFDNKMNLIALPTIQSFQQNDLIINESFHLNKEKVLIIDVRTNNIIIKVSIGMNDIAPSLINIRTKYDEIG